MKTHDNTILLSKLKEYLMNLGSLAVAFSGGVDSTFLTKASFDALKNNLVAIIAYSPLIPKREYEEAIEFLENSGIKYEVVEVNIEDIKSFTDNPLDRCYICKGRIFSRIIEAANMLGIRNIADGSNLDDQQDYRPGSRALKELGVLSPLKELGFTKSNIRSISKEMGLPTWDKPAYACLASRIPYGHEITTEKLEAIDKGEQFLIDLGFKQMRVRHHMDIARIEVPKEEFARFSNEDMCNKIYEKFKELGFLYTALDIAGYRTGSMNEGIT
ncbi:MAG: ATP-dependent sacrificial sulfur transferase LarE [Bacillota bacterium]|nr:ATP-dependent sacrificial sulfur transferase LarE [Bacillota bacterium]